MSLIPYKTGSNLTIMNTLSANFKDKDGKFHEGLIMIYKDCDTGIKYKTEIIDPSYTFYVAKPNERVNYNRLFIEKDKVEPVTVPHRAVEKEIAKITGNYQYFKDNITTGNRGENKKLHAHPDIFRSDMHIEDYYRFLFGTQFRNEPCPISKSYLDIETDSINMVGDFPQLGECPVNAVTLIMPHIDQAFTFLLETEGNQQIQEFKKSVEDGSIFQELREFITNAVNGPQFAAKNGLDKLNFNFLFYKPEDEIKLITDIFNAINSYTPDFVLAWNMSFDIPYLMERIRVLGYNPEDIICNKDFQIKYCMYHVDEMSLNEYAERGDYALISSYSCFIDQMIQYASRRKGRARPISFSLDYTGETVAGVKKLDYKHITTNIADLPYKDYKTFVFYNIMDVIVQVCIENKTGDLDYMFTKSLVNNTRYSKCHRQTIYLSNRGSKEFDRNGFIIGNNANKFNHKPESKFPGAFVADPLRVNNNSRKRIGGTYVSVFDVLNDFDRSIVA